MTTEKDHPPIDSASEASQNAETPEALDTLPTLDAGDIANAPKRIRARRNQEAAAKKGAAGGAGPAAKNPLAKAASIVNAGLNAESAVQDWLPDSGEPNAEPNREHEDTADSAIHEAATEAASANAEIVEPADAPEALQAASGTGTVTFIDQPFQNPMMEVTEAQADAEPLELDEDFDEDVEEDFAENFEENVQEDSEEGAEEEDSEENIENEPEVDAESAEDSGDSEDPSVSADDEDRAESADAAAASNASEGLSEDSLDTSGPHEFAREEASVAEGTDADSEAQFANLTRAMAVEQAEQIKHLETVAGENEAAAEARLQNEIAEDEALERELAAEREASTEELEELDPELQAALPKAPVTQADGSLDLSEVMSCIEALLFMSDKPMSTARLQELLGPDFSVEIFDQAVAALQARYAETAHGFELVAVGGGFQFRTKVGRAALAKKLAKVQTQRLSGGAMETLAIIAYRQPVLKDEIDKVRGVDSSHFIRGLMDKKLIEISGRSEMVGRPMLYSTTPQFLELFGLADLAAMPSLRELEEMIPQSQSKNPEDEDPRVKEMRRLVGEMKTSSSQSILDYDPREDEKILKEIRERVNAIPTSSPSIDAQKAAEKEAELLKKAKASGLLDALDETPVGETGQLPFEAEAAAAVAAAEAANADMLAGAESLAADPDSADSAATEPNVME